MKAAIIGLGARSTAYLPLIKALPGSCIAAVCDIDAERMRRYIDTFLADSPPALATCDHREAMACPLVDTLIICTPDTTHLSLLCDAVATGKSILLEKPVATTIKDARAVYEAGGGYGRPLAIGFVLRYTPLYRKIHEIVNQGILGDVVSITAKEMLDARHAGSFYRRWNRFSALTGGLMNAKCCHDLDILNWLAGADPQCVSAFGGLRFFTASHELPERCAHCGRYGSCPYAFDYAHYESMYKGFVSATDLCVYTSDKDIVDHEVMNIRYENGIVAQFELCMFSPEENRTMTVFGTKAMLQADFQRASVRVAQAGTMDKVWNFDNMETGHGGGDGNIIAELNRAAGQGLPLNHARAGFLSTAVALAGEKSMGLGGAAVNIREFAGL